MEMRFIAHIVGGNLMQLSMLFVDGDKKGKRVIHMKGFLHLNIWIMFSIIAECAKKHVSINIL